MRSDGGTMLEQRPDSNTAKDIRMLRMICRALAAGTALFAAVAAGLTVARISPGGNIGSPQPGTISTGMLLLGLTAVVGFSQAVAWFFMRGAAIKSASKTWENPGDVEVRERKLWGHYGALSVMRCALVEGFGILGIVTLFVGGVWWGLVAPAIAIVVILSSLPSQAGYENFLTDATRRF